MGRTKEIERKAKENMKKNKILIMASSLIITAASLSFIMAGPAYAAEGWTKDSGAWKYLDSQDRPVKNTWEQSKDDWFYLGPDETMLRNTFIRQGGALYYVDDDGKRLQGQWLQVKEKTDTGQEPGWYHFGPDGKAEQAGSKHVKNVIGGKAYIFGDDCRMLTGWMDQDGRLLDPADNPLISGVYYAGEDGALLSNRWFRYEPEHLGDTDDLTSSITGKSYSDYPQIWLYFDQNYMRVKSSNGQVKEKTIEGNTYGFDENGIMLPWWNQVASVSNADKSNPTSDMAPKFYSGYNGGSLLKNQWLWMYPSEDLSQKDNQNEEYSWWRTDDSGKVIQDRIKQINGRSYAFDGLGRMKTGFVLFDGTKTYVAQYDPGDWSADDFINGKLYGIDRSDLYFFSPDQQKDGSMKTGKAVKIELQDGVHTFGFKNNGEAYGNRDKLQRVQDTFYINGLRLDAHKDFGYGVVKAKPDRDDYRVVDQNGKLVSGDKKLLKDKDGGYIIILRGRFAARVSDEEKPRWYNGPEGRGYYHYDKGNKEDPYAGGMIAGYDTEPSLDGLADEQKLNF